MLKRTGRYLIAIGSKTTHPWARFLHRVWLTKLARGWSGILHVRCWISEATWLWCSIVWHIQVLPFALAGSSLLAIGTELTNLRLKSARCRLSNAWGGIISVVTARSATSLLVLAVGSELTGLFAITVCCRALLIPLFGRVMHKATIVFGAVAVEFTESLSDRQSFVRIIQNRACRRWVTAGRGGGEGARDVLICAKQLGARTLIVLHLL